MKLYACAVHYQYLTSILFRDECQRGQINFLFHEPTEAIRHIRWYLATYNIIPNFHLSVDRLLLLPLAHGMFSQFFFLYLFYCISEFYEATIWNTKFAPRRI